MKHSFYDVLEHRKVQATVTRKVSYSTRGGKRYALKGKTRDGRNLTAFVSYDDWLDATV